MGCLEEPNKLRMHLFLRDLLKVIEVPSEIRATQDKLWGFGILCSIGYVKANLLVQFWYANILSVRRGGTIETFPLV